MEDPYILMVVLKLSTTILSQAAISYYLPLREVDPASDTVASWVSLNAFNPELKRREVRH